MDDIAVIRKNIKEINDYVISVEEFFTNLNKEMKEMKEDISSIKEFVEEINDKIDNIDTATFFSGKS